ncbi:NAD-dependent dehydratase [Luteimonas suaedae]|uniref:NAD-dependent dehydratase n=1 Tax=Luteimonas suaedae TaxID=2605430 RepID=UPI0011EF472F|nr:NAD-dependent dehydratase [Luteimonas suaedae]
MKLLHVGATGLVGGHVLSQALAHPRIERVTAPTRRPLEAHARLVNPVVDFEHLPEDADWWAADAVVCTLGTTRAKAGSDQAFRRVDLDYPLAVARIAHRHGARAFALNSALGADADARILYSRTKGELERALADVGFVSLTFVRPGLIGGDRAEFRAGERAASALLRVLAPVLPRRYRINPAANVAAALLDAVVDPRPGRHVVGSERLA